jgi:hypothetical protein
MKTTTRNITPEPVQQRRVVRPRYEVVEAAMETPFVPTIVSVISMHSTAAEAWRAWRRIAVRSKMGDPNVYVWDSERRCIVGRKRS